MVKRNKDLHIHILQEPSDFSNDQGINSSCKIKSNGYQLGELKAVGAIPCEEQEGTTNWAWLNKVN